MPAGSGIATDTAGAVDESQTADTDRLRHLLPVLDVGCGINKYPGAIGLDRNPNTRADVIADLDAYPFPFRDGAFREVRAIHVIEHVSDVIRTMEEFHRLLAPGGRAVIVTPHYTDFSSFCDPTHRWHLNSFSLRYFGDDDGGYGYYSRARFREISTHVQLLAFWRYLGFEFLVNRWRWFRRFWEFYLCYLVRGKVIEWQVEAIHTGAANGFPDGLFDPDSSSGS
ncbi:MAG TPA: methyltransferase domain-containing protein [Bryobacteraceae bacterium]